MRWSDDLQVLIPNALQPAEVDEVILCQMIGKAIVLVREDQLSLAIGRRGQNVRLGSKLCGWDIEIMTREELDSEIERAVAGFSELDGVDPSLAERLVGEGFLTYDELSVIEPDAMMAMGNLTEEQVQHIVDQAEAKAEAAEVAAAAERRRQREQERIDAATAEADQKEAGVTASPMARVRQPLRTAAATRGRIRPMEPRHETAEDAAGNTTGGDSASVQLPDRAHSAIESVYLWVSHQYTCGFTSR